MTEEENIERAGDEDYGQYIVHYEDIPMEELAPGAWSHLVAGKEAVVSFLTIPAGTYFPVHQHVAEQIMVVLEGYIDQVIDGKMYRVNAGDVIVMPSNIPHGGYVRDQDCKVIDIFAPLREDLAERAAGAKAKMAEQGLGGHEYPPGGRTLAEDFVDLDAQAFDACRFNRRASAHLALIRVS